MSVREYIGARYVPLFADPIEWDDTRTYEPLTVVLYQGNSFTSRQYVPVGIAIDNETYWAETGNYNAQVEAYRNEVTAIDERLDAVESKFPISTTDIKDNAITADKIEIAKDKYTEVNFRNIDRFIDSDRTVSPQTMCVFEQDNVLYWAQFINDGTTDYITIRNLATKAEVGRFTGDLGHGYTLSYNPERKMLLLHSGETAPYTLFFINVETIANPILSQTASTMLNQAIFYESDKIAGFTSSDTLFTIVDESFNVIESLTMDLNGYSYGNGYIFQSMQWSEQDEMLYICTSAPNGIIECVKDNGKMAMVDFIHIAPYYTYLSMEEVEASCKCGSKMYINQYDVVDDVMTISLLEWDMVNGTLPNIDQKQFAYTYLNEVKFEINQNASLISDGSVFALAGDALNFARSLNSVGCINLDFASDYDHAINIVGQMVRITTKTNTGYVIGGISVSADGLMLWDTNYAHIDDTKLTFTSGGVTHPVCLWVYNMGRVKFIQAGHFDNTITTDTPYNVVMDSGMVYIAPQPGTQYEGFYRWGQVYCMSESQLGRYVNCIVETVVSS